MSPGMIKDLVDLISILSLVVVFGGGVLVAMLLKGRHERMLVEQERLLEDQRHRQEMERLQHQKELAQATGDAIVLLMADEDLAADFDKRLQLAMQKNAKDSRTGVRVGGEEQKTGDGAAESGAASTTAAVPAQRPTSRTARRPRVG